MTGAPTIGSALRAAADALGEAGVENPLREARLLVGHALGLAPPAVPLEPRQPLDDAESQMLDTLLLRRCERRPMAQVLGTRAFWNLEFDVTPDTLVPRPDSETLVEAAFEVFPDRDAPLTVLDLGTGTGCLLLSVLGERPRATGLGVDIEPAALEVARANAGRLGFNGRARFQQGDWTSGLVGPFDLILANPPYIPTGDIDGLAPEVARHEPRVALDGGPDGLDCYRAMARGVESVLAPGGRLVAEIGYDQAESASAVFAEAGLEIEGIRRDLAGNDRCLVARVYD